MTVIPITLNSGNTIPAAPRRVAENNPSFKSNEMEKDAFVKRPRESFLHKYRDIIGFLVGGFAGDIIWSKTLRSKVEGMKNMTKFKSGALYFGLSLVTAFVGGMIALQIGKKD